MFNEEFEHQSDPLDLSVAQQEMILAAQIAIRKPEGPRPTGYCLDPNCGEQLVSDDVLDRIQAGDQPSDGIRRWCNPDCRESWEREKSARSRGK